MDDKAEDHGQRRAPAGRAVTIRDVARLAGVSIKTVSRVLNREPHVRADTRARVESAVAALGYRPHLSARSLAGQRSFLIGLPLANPSPHYLVDVESGALCACNRHGFGLALIACEKDGRALPEQLISFARQARLDGLLLFPPVSDRPDVLDALSEAGLPTARLAPHDERLLGPVAAIDDERAAAEMTRHLIALGHRRIAFIRADPAHAAAARREAGFRAALREAGLEPDERLVVAGDLTFAAGLAALSRLLAVDPPPSAVFAANDEMAAGCLYLAHERGLAVPADISIAGFDDSPLASQLWPKLTTVRQPVFAMAEAATELLIAQIGAAAGGRPAEIPPARARFAAALVVRESTGPAPRHPGRRRPKTGSQP